MKPVRSKGDSPNVDGTAGKENGMPGKYSPLEEHLRSLPASQLEVKLTFAQIEVILKSKLPTSAQEQSWWDHATEGNHVNTRAWFNAGWRVGQVHLRGKWVRFVRE